MARKKKKVQLRTRQQKRAAQRIANLNPKAVKRLANSGFGSATVGGVVRRRRLRKGVGSTSTAVNAENVPIKDKKLGPRTKQIMRAVGRAGYKGNAKAVYKSAAKKGRKKRR